MQLSESRPNLPQLTSLRFFAALLIVFHHFGLDILPDLPGLVEFVKNGSIAVTFFFVLSGFILVYTYQKPGKPLNTRSFLLARAARILPVYFVALILGLPAVVKAAQAPGSEGMIQVLVLPLLLSSILMQAWFPPYSNIANPPGWSISSETFFYLCFPFLLKPTPLRFLGRHKKRLFIALWILGSLPCFWLWLTHPEIDHAGQNSGHILDLMRWVGFWPLFRIPEFIMGMILGIAYLEGRRNPWPLTTALLATIAVALFLTLPPQEIRSLAHDALLAPLFVLVIWSCTSFQGQALRLFSWKPLVFLGEASFGLYILHAPIKSAWTFMWQVFHLPASPPLFFWSYLAGVLALSSLSFVWLETPARKWIRARFSPR